MYRGNLEWAPNSEIDALHVICYKSLPLIKRLSSVRRCPCSVRRPSCIRSSLEFMLNVVVTSLTESFIPFSYDNCTSSEEGMSETTDVFNASRDTACLSS